MVGREVMKVGDVVIDRWDEESYIIEVHERSNTVVTFSTKPGRHQPTVYRIEDLRVFEPPVGPLDEDR